MNDRPHYPWKPGEELFAEELNAAIANAGAIAISLGAGGDTINAGAYGVRADYLQLAGPVSWNGTTVTITGASFTVADVGKTLIMPAGGGVTSAPALVEIVGFTSPTVVTVDQVAGTPFSGATWQINGLTIPTVNNYGSGGASVGETLTMQGGSFARPAVWLTYQIRAQSATIVTAGSGGPPSATVYLRGTTGHGRRPLFQGTTDASGVLTSLTLLEAGVLYQNPAVATAEPLAADQQQLTLPGTWTAGATQVTLGASVSTNVISVLRVGMSLTATGDSNAQGIKIGSVITAIAGSVITFTPAAVNAGTGADVNFIFNAVKATFNATFVNSSTTITATTSLPAWVQPGCLISGAGIAGGSDPKASAASNTTITAIDGPRTGLTLSQPTTRAATTAVSLILNPALSGVVASIVFEPVILKLKDAGVYSALPSFPANVQGAVNRGVTITPPTSAALVVGCGTDNAAAFAGWANAVRSAVTAIASQVYSLGAGVEAVVQPGNYLSSAPINLVGMQSPGLFMRFNGAVLHSVAAGKCAIDMRAGKFFVVDHPTIMGDQYFPPLVGLALGIFDNRFAGQVNVRSPTCWGYFSLAGMTIQNSEGTLIDECHVQNLYVPPSSYLPPLPATPRLPFPPVFGICVDGYQHWQFLCDNGDPITLPNDAPQSFIDLRISRGTSMCPGGGIPWTFNGVKGCNVLNGYAETTGLPAVLWFGDNSADAELHIHCELKNGPGGTAGLQDAMMVASLDNPVFQFNGIFRDPLSQAQNAIIAYDLERNYGRTDLGPTTSGGDFTSYRAVIDVAGFTSRGTQVFDYFNNVMYQQSIFGGEIIVGSTNHTALPHLMNLPASVFGTLRKGDTEQDLNYYGYLRADSSFIRGTVNAGDDISTTGWVNAEDGIRIGAVGFPRANLTYDGTAISSNVPINVTATGSTTARSLQSRFAEVINVKDYGAVGDGVTNDRPAIAAALTAAGSGTVKTVYFPPSSNPYLLAANLTVPSGVTLMAEPGTATLKASLSNGSTPLLLTMETAQQGVLIYGLILDGNVSGQKGGGGASNGTRVNGVVGASRVVFDHCRFQNTLGQALQFSNSVSYSGVRHCTFDNVGMYWHTSGLIGDAHQAVTLTDTVEGGSVGNFVESCLFTNIGYDCINTCYQTGMLVQGNRGFLANQQWYAGGVGNALMFSFGSRGMHVVNNVCWQASGNAFDFGGESALTLVGNKAYKSGVSGISIGTGIQYGIATGTNHFVISGNISMNAGQNISGVGLAFLHGGAGGGPTANGVIAGNTFSDDQTTHTQTYGIAAIDTGTGLPTLTNVMVGLDNNMVGNITAPFGGGLTYTTAATATGTPTSRTLADRFADVVNVKDFGAVFDGASHPLSAYYSTLAAAQAVYPHAVALTDEIDGVAIQAAINYCHARVVNYSYGGTVMLPQGNGLVNQPLTISKPNVSLASRGAEFMLNSNVARSTPSAPTWLTWTGAARTAGQFQRNMLTVAPTDGQRLLTGTNVTGILFYCNQIAGTAGPLIASVRHARIDVATHEPAGVAYAGAVLTAGSQAITVSSTAGLRVGESVVSASLPWGAYIARIVDGTHFNASVQASATSTETITIGGEGIRFDVVDGLADSNDTQYLRVRFYGYALAGAANATGPLMLIGGSCVAGGSGGTHFGNTSLNWFETIEGCYNNGHAVVMNNSDHNFFENITPQKIGAGAGRGLICNGSLDPNNAGARWHVINHGGDGGIHAGTDTAGFTAVAYRNRFHYLDHSNSAPLPTIGAGASVFVGTDDQIVLGFNGDINQALLLNYPDGTIAGGNTRGHQSVDLQNARAAATQVASGTLAVIAGGQNNTASANWSSVAGGTTNTASGLYASVVGGEVCTASGTAAVAGGNSNIASGDYSTAFGAAAAADLYASFTIAGGLVASGRKAQTTTQMLRANSATNTTPVRLTADGAAAGSLNVGNLTYANQANSLRVRLIATDGANYYAWTQPLGLLTRAGGVASVVYTPGTPVIVTRGTTAGIAITEAADTTNGGYSLTFTPPTGNVAVWRVVATAEWTRVDGA